MTRLPAGDRVRLCALALALAAWIVPAAAPAAGAGPADPGTPATPPGGPGLALATQTTWVTPGSTFELHLKVSAGRPASSLALVLDVYSRLTTRSSFERSLQGHFDGSVLRSLGPLPLDSLPTDPTGAVVVALATSGAGALPLGACPGSCEGVWPIRVELVDRAQGSTLDQLVTHMVVADPAPQQGRLHVATVLPLAWPPDMSPTGTPILDPASSTGLATVASALSADPGVPLTLAPQPETLAALAGSRRPADAQTLAALTRLAAAPLVHQVLRLPYSSADLASLAADGLTGEIAAQLARGSQVLASVLGVRPDPRTWLVQGGLNGPALAALQAAGVGQLAIPDNDLTPYSGRLTLTAAFELQAGSGPGPMAVSVDPELAAHFVNGGGQVLAAHQLLADLAIVYFGQPGSPSPRAMVAVPPEGWVPDAAFLSTLLDGLASSPILDPVTLDGLFALGTQASPPLARRLAPGAGSPGPLPARAIERARARLNAFSSMLDQPGPVVEPISDLVLASQSRLLRPDAQQRYVAYADSAIAADLSQMQFAPDRTVTLTSRSGRIPVTIISTAPYVIHAILVVSSDKLGFPRGIFHPLTIQPNANAEYIDVQSHSSGSFPLSVALVSPTGHLTVLQARFTVRSTAASGVAVFLSAGALAILLVWWLNTVRRSRAQRRLEELSEAP